MTRVGGRFLSHCSSAARAAAILAMAGPCTFFAAPGLAGAGPSGSRVAASTVPAAVAAPAPHPGA
ncbi:MAG: hypothetical protein QOK11_1132 [Pseudonocardiales bacterium]|nr:hypothetical protein [Pseudonocardiales bacterium]